MANVIGTGRADKLTAEGDAGSFLAGEGRGDQLTGGQGGDTILGGGGNDVIAGNGGNDTLFGASTAGGKVDLTKFAIAEDAKGSVTFNFEEAGFKNTLGMYKIDSAGKIYDVNVLFANASLKGSGGDLVAGKSTVNFDLEAGDKIGFFIVPNAFGTSGMDKLLSDKGASWKFVDSAGQDANVNGGKELKLVHVGKDGKQTDVKGQYGTNTFHSVDDGAMGLNGDGMKHVVGEVDVAKGTVKIGFEDLKWGGDRDFDDSVFTFTLGTTNAALVSKLDTKPGTSSDADLISGGDGDDKIFGMADNDEIYGGTGNDRIWGNSGNDVISGDVGDDSLYGGKGDDVISGGDGNDTVKGDSGNDLVMGDAGDDKLDGGSGFDTVDYSGAKGGVSIDLHAGKASGGGMGDDSLKGFEAVVGSAFDDVIKGNKLANTIDGGDGNDTIRSLQGADTLTGGAGSDTFVFTKSDTLKDGVHQGVDKITDFSKEDRLDLTNFFNGQKGGSIDDMVSIKDDGQNSHVFANVGGSMVEVAVLENFSGHSASDLLKDGLILV